MKKMIILCTVIALLFSMTCISASAEEAEFPYSDSRDVPSEIMEKFDIGNIDVVVRCYNISINLYFPLCDNMQEVFDRSQRVEFFACKTKDGKLYRLRVDNQVNYQFGEDNGPQKLLENQVVLTEYLTQEALKAVSQDIVLENMYFLSGEYSYTGSAIYYRTNLGEYIFYNDYYSSRIFSLDAFFAYKKAEYQEKIAKLQSVLVDDGTSYLDLWDLSVYDYTSPNFNPDAPFPEVEYPNTEFPYSDSREVPDEIMKKIDAEETVTVLRYYPVTPRMTFSIFDNMEEVFGWRHPNARFWLQLKKDGSFHIHTIDFDGHYTVRSSGNGAAFSRVVLEEYQTQEALKAVSPDIVLENVYILSGAHDYQGSAIYYRTNMGDYIFYNDFHSNRLFSLDAFFAYKQAKYQEEIAIQQGVFKDGGTSYLDLWDLSVYDYTSPNFNPNAPFPEIDIPKQDAVPNATVPTSNSIAPTENTVNPLLLWVGIGTGVLLVAGATVFYFIRRKKSTVAE